MTTVHTTRGPVDTGPVDADTVDTDPVDLWPAFTTHTADDVAVGAVRLTRLVAWCDTPSVHTAHAVLPGTGGQPSDVESASVVVARVVAVEWRSDLRMHVLIDADLRGCTPFVAAARVIGRAATVHLSAATLSCAAAGQEAGIPLRLPSDVVVGDLVVVPCAGATYLRDVAVA